jgi:hypothetical protein
MRMNVDGWRGGMRLLTELHSADPAVLVALWRGTKAPGTVMNRSIWCALFRRAGYTVNGQPAPRPAQPVQVFRGAHPASRLGMSWSTDMAVAQRFTRRPGTRLWRATVAPQHLLAYLSYPGDPEQEYVIDPRGLSNVVEVSSDSRSR